MSCCIRCREAFSLIEVIVVISIIGVLTGLIVPGVQKAREAGARAQCQNNMRQVIYAVHMFHDAEKRLPCSLWATQNGVNYGIGPNSRAWSYLAFCLPYLEQQPLFLEAGIPTSNISANNASATGVAIFLCPSDALATMQPRVDAGNIQGLPVGRSSYKGVSGSNWGEDFDVGQVSKGPQPTDWPNLGTNGSYDGQDNGDGMFYRFSLLNPLRLTDITDGTSQTFAIGEDVQALDNYLNWPYTNGQVGTCAIPLNVIRPFGGAYAPTDLSNCEGFKSLHPGGGNFAFADGSVRFVWNTIDLYVYRALATVQGGESVEAP